MIEALKELVAALEDKTDAQSTLLTAYRMGNNARLSDSALTKLEKAVGRCAKAYERVALDESDAKVLDSQT